uniref:Uncharacterized protein n=1 Tax=viral metagenome TaxID=1070528 RepID=A0A6M3L6E5_9ZZZZ
MWTKEKKKEYMHSYYKARYTCTKYKLPCQHGNKKSECPICKKEASRRYTIAHADNIRAKRMKHYYEVVKPRDGIGDKIIKTPGEKRIKRNERDREWRRAILLHYGDKCAICGDTSNLEIDHKFGYGRDHRKELAKTLGRSEKYFIGGGGFYRWLLTNNYPNDYTVNGVMYKDGFRVLCKSCNVMQKKKDRCNHFATK